MGDYYQTVVDRDVRLEDAGDLAGEVVRWLVERGIVEPTLRDCTLGEAGHPPGPRYGDVVDLPDDCRETTRELVTNGLEVVVGRTVFYAGQGDGFALICRRCGVRLDDGGEAWSQAMGEWHKATGDATFCCPRCGQAELVTEWQYDPPWGFGNLGFTFWNWPPLKPAFVAELSARLRHRTVLVRGKL